MSRGHIRVTSLPAGDNADGTIAANNYSDSDSASEPGSDYASEYGSDHLSDSGSDHSSDSDSKDTSDTSSLGLTYKRYSDETWCAARQKEDVSDRRAEFPFEAFTASIEESNVFSEAQDSSNEKPEGRYKRWLKVNHQALIALEGYLMCNRWAEPAIEDSRELRMNLITLWKILSWANQYISRHNCKEFLHAV